ncbi:MAG TPA: enoyl-CoA hydratase/isomerase family protein [Vicinamibacteria bacterium]|nr:enoyl-CoA hydratase/isomerase family protein [Vicinamibacteria bacterium]
MRVRLSYAPPRARLTLSHSPLNVFDGDMLKELSRGLDDIGSRTDVHVVILDSAEKVFSAGVDVRDHLPERLNEMLERFHGVCRQLLRLDAITLALVSGHAFGGAMELLACCDFVIATDEAAFAQPEIDLACFPPLGAAIYPKLLGSKRAAEIVLLGRRLSAREAEDFGLVTKVVSEDALQAEAEVLLRSLAEKSPAALRIAKKALRLGLPRALEGLEEIEALYRDELAATEDMVEGLRAFLEKRKPIFRGK